MKSISKYISNQQHSHVEDVTVTTLVKYIYFFFIDERPHKNKIKVQDEKEPGNRIDDEILFETISDLHHTLVTRLSSTRLMYRM